MTSQRESKSAYNMICLEVERVSSEVDKCKTLVPFVDYAERLSHTQREYIKQFNNMSSRERTDGSLLIQMLQNQINRRISVFEAKATLGKIELR